MRRRTSTIVHGIFLFLLMGPVTPAPTPLAWADDASAEKGRPGAGAEASDADRGLRIEWEDDWLYIRGDRVPGDEIRIHYLEAYCRPNSHTTDWVEHTVIDHEAELVAAADDGRRIELRDELKDGVVVRHVITAGEDEITFRLTAKNPTDEPSEAHWAQPCVRVGPFTGTGPEQTDDKYAYINKSFVFMDGELRRMPFEPWATEARYTPGQVWRAPNVKPADVNPRPLNPEVPSNGLIGCFGKDGETILATAWQPYQELFRGVGRCLHSDFRLGGIEPGETKAIRGKLYIVPNDVDALLKRYRADFPEHRKLHGQ